MKIFISLIVTSIFLNASTLNIAVAANVSYAIEALKVAFEKENPEIKCNIILGSSGKLTAQIMHGAPYHIFMSANMLYPQKLFDKGLALHPPKIYAKGKLALISLKKRENLSLNLLTKKSISRIAIANPKTAPYGVAAKEALVDAGIYLKLKPKFIYGESIAQTLSFAITAADVGIIAASALYSKKMAYLKKGTHWITLPLDSYTPISQGIVRIKESSQTLAFYNFILSTQAKSIFKSYGYLESE